MAFWTTTADGRAATAVWEVDDAADRELEPGPFDAAPGFGGPDAVPLPAVPATCDVPSAGAVAAKYCGAGPPWLTPVLC